MTCFLEKWLRPTRGVTLVELLMALVIAGLVFAGVYQMYINSIRTGSVQEGVADMQQTARVVMDQLMRELRLSGYNPATPGGMVGILNLVANPSELNPTSGTPRQLQLQGDFDGDNTLDQVMYAISLTDPAHPWLTRALNSDPAVKFGSNIENLKVTYYDANNNLINVASCVAPCGAQVKRVTVQLTVRTDQPDKDFEDPVFNDGYRRRTLESDVVLRNKGSVADATPPSCPTNVAAVITGDCRIIHVSWDRPADPDGDLGGYYIYYDQNPISTSTSAFVNITDIQPNPPPNYSNDLSVPSTGTWNIAVASYDRSGNLCDSNAANGNPPADPVVASGSPINIGAAENKTPAAPGNAVAVPADNQVTVSWGQVLTNTDGSAANDLTGYRLYRSTQPDMSNEVLIANESALSISQVVGGGVVQTTQYVDNDTNTFINDLPAGPDNCTVYYYQVSVVDRCSLESARSTVQSVKPDGTSSPGVTPPDNGKAPPPPTITSLLAGDDTSSIIVNWTVVAPSSSQSTPVGVKIYYRVQGTSPWTLAADIPITGALPASGQQIINGLSSYTVYDVMVSAYDDPATECGNSSDSTINSISTAACAPRNGLLTDPNLYYKIFPGVTTSGVEIPKDGSGQIGELSPSGERYVTWVVAPVDCTPDSSSFAAQGFDYKNPPVYDQVAADPGAGTSAHVEFYINDPGGPNQNADLRYGTAATGSNPGNALFPTNSGNIDYAPRGSDTYYHFPSDPLSSAHLDTSKFCDADYDFKIISVDGELYNATSAIPLEIKNGGIEMDSSVTVTSDITTVDDTHHLVRFGIKNTNSVIDLKLNKITLDWDNNNAVLEKLEVLSSDKTTVLGEWDSATGIPAGLAGIGTELTLNPVPTIKKAGSGGSADKGYIRLTFKNSSGAVASNVDMRAKTITITRLEQQDEDATGSNGICTTTSAGAAAIHQNPTVSPAATDTVQDQPAANTVPSQTPGAIVLNTTNSVTVTTKVTPDASGPLASVKLYYNVDGAFQATAPVRPSSTGGGGSYASSVTGTEISTNTWSFVIPANSGNRIWFYLEAMDGTVTDPFARNFDIYPDQGVFTYDQPASLVITLDGNWDQTDAGPGCPTPDRVVVTGTVKDQNNTAVSGAKVDITISGTGGPVNSTVTSNVAGGFSYTSPYTFTGNATVSTQTSKIGYITKSCSLSPISFSACSNAQTATCN